MVKLKINGQEISVKEGTTIMDAAKKVGIEIPHLCYLKEINEIGACRVCVVELVGHDKLVTACNTACEEGMEVITNSPKVRENRRLNVELILSDHRSNCATCVRSGNCSLQKVANSLGIIENRYDNIADKYKADVSLPLVRDNSKCIKCMRCIQVCEKIQSIGVWELIGSGFRATVGVKGNKKLEDSNCVLCGQCVTHCPVGALRARDDRNELLAALADPNKKVVVQVAPAVRTAWADEMGIAKSKATMGQLVCALKKLGCDYVFDTNFTADLTIMEEGSEFLERLAHKEDYKWPMFTSCCPGWVRFAKTQYPSMVKQLSTAKSPQQMFGAMAKTYIAEKLGENPDNIYSVSIMPCVAKKYERQVPEVNNAGHGYDVDLVLTTRELARMIKADAIKIEDLVDTPYDGIFGEGTGAAVIFGVTGGVMEAALRSAYYLVTGSNPAPDAFKEVRGYKGWREAKFNLAGAELKVAVVTGLANARELLDAVNRGEVEYDFVEVMTCPGGCVGGGGQPFEDGMEKAEVRGKCLYGLDEANDIRFSHENSTVQLAYKEFLEKPLSHKSHELLHTNLESWSLDMK